MTTRTLYTYDADTGQLQVYSRRTGAVGELGMLIGRLTDEMYEERLERELERLRASIAAAYGYMWHVNNEPGTPAMVYTPERAAYEARKILRGLLTHQERGDAIHAARLAIESAEGK